MVINTKTFLWTGLFAAFAANLSATPQLTLLQPTPSLVTVAQGSNGSLNIDARNIGDGSLNLTATGNASWLSPTIGAAHACSDGSGASCIPVQIALKTSSLAAGTYVGLVTVSDPNAVDSPQVIPVSVEVGSGVPPKMDFTLPPGGTASAQFGTTASALVTATSPNQGLIAVAQNGGSPFSPSIPYLVTANASAGSLSPGDYTGTVSVVGSTNSADNKTIAITVHVVASTLTGPVIQIGGALNNATFATGEKLAQGDIVALFGSNFISGSPVVGTTSPLATNLGGVQVLLNNQPMPLYYVYPGQIGFQIPYTTPIGAATLQVNANGTNGNTISITIDKAEPRILTLALAPPNTGYGIVTNPDASLTIPTALGGVPAKLGGTIVIYAIGFGQTNPTATAGTGAPSAEPLARVTDNPTVCFVEPTPFNPSGLCVTPAYAGLAPTFAGLYQINVAVPLNAPTGDQVEINILTDDGASNTVYIAIQP